MEIIETICSDLNLPHGDLFTQDWAYELPDQYRTKDWLKKYISAYLYNGYPTTGQRELMILALDVCNDLLSSGLSSNDAVIQSVLSALLDHYKEYVDLVDYWAVDGEPLRDCFALTPLIRELRLKHG